MYRVLAFLAVISLFAVSSRVQAQPVSPGPWEFTLSGAGASDESLNGGTFSVQGSAGYFLDDRWELSLRQTIGYTDVTDNFSGATRVALDYHFDLDRWRPFVGVGLGYTYGGEFADTWGGGPEGGVKYFVNDTTFLYGSIGYDYFFRDASNNQGDFSDGQFVYGVGIGFRW